MANFYWNAKPTEVTLPTLPSLFLERLAEILPGVPSSCVTGRWLPLFTDVWSGIQGSQLRFQCGRDALASVDVHVQRTTMRFDIVVIKAFRGTKLYYYLLRLALDRYPNVLAIPAHMEVAFSENARNFADDTFDSLEALRAFDPTRLPADQVKKVRVDWIRALNELPAIKARKRAGFGRVTSLLLNLQQSSISFQALKGEPLPVDEVRVGVLSGKQHWTLERDGTLTASNGLSFPLPDYGHIDRTRVDHFSGRFGTVVTELGDGLKRRTSSPRIDKWQSEKSKRMGSFGSMRRSRSVAARQSRQFAVLLCVQRSRRSTCKICVSTGRKSVAGSTQRHSPKSMPSSCLTTHRRNMLSRLQALPSRGDGSKYFIDRWRAVR